MLSRGHISLKTAMELKSLFVNLSLLPFLALGRFPQDPCKDDFQICEATEDNLIEIISEVETIEECRDLCHNSYPNCKFFNHFSNRTFPFTNTCMILDACDELRDCDYCYVEEAYCERPFCGSTVEGRIGDNLIERVPLVPSEKDCKIICADTEGCTYYTYYEETHDSLPKSCFLLSTFEFPVKRCQDCITSPINCNVGICGFYKEENVTASLVIKKTTTVRVLMLGRCNPLKALAMGPGGGYSNSNSDVLGCYAFGGGGSGQLNFTYIPLNGLVSLLIFVDARAGRAMATFIRDWNREDEFLIAAAGGGGSVVDSTRAGDGYSGGGGRGITCWSLISDEFGGDGGCNGTSGQPGKNNYEGSPGIGSGFQLDTLPFQTFSIR